MTITPLGDYRPERIPPEHREARPSGDYAYPKIEAFIRYCRAAEKVFKGQKAQGRIQNIVHFEPFCGPGWNKTRNSQRRFKGTPLRAVEELKSIIIAERCRTRRVLDAVSQLFEIRD